MEFLSPDMFGMKKKEFVFMFLSGGIIVLCLENTQYP